MHGEALFLIHLAAVDTSIPALCGCAACMSVYSVVHQFCIVSSDKLATLLIAPPVTTCLPLDGSLPPLLQLIHLAVLSNVYLLSHIFSCCLDPPLPDAACSLVLLRASWATAHISSGHPLSQHSTASFDHQLSVCLCPACT